MVVPSSFDKAINSGSPFQTVLLTLSYGPSRLRVAGATPPSRHLDEGLEGGRRRVHDLCVRLVRGLRLNEVGELGGQVHVRPLHGAALQGSEAVRPGLTQLGAARSRR